MDIIHTYTLIDLKVIIIIIIFIVLNVSEEYCKQVDLCVMYVYFNIHTYIGLHTILIVSLLRQGSMYAFINVVIMTIINSHNHNRLNY